MNFFEYSYTTNRTAVAGIVRIMVGFNPLYKALTPSVLAIFNPIINILVFILEIWTRLLITSAGNMAVHKQIPPTEPAIDVRNIPISSFF